MFQHTIQSYDDQMDSLNRLIAKMGNQCVSMVGQSVDSLLTSNNVLAQDVITQDQTVNESLNSATKLAQTILALRAPLANDLRFVLSALQVSLNLERVGDLAKNISKMVVKSDLFVPESAEFQLRSMGQMASDNLMTCLQSYNHDDEKGAVKSYLADKQLDRMHRQFSSSVLEDIREGKGDLDTSVNLLFVSRHLERIGDHGKNISEAAMFRITGQVGDIDDSE